MLVGVENVTGVVSMVGRYVQSKTEAHTRTTEEKQRKNERREETEAGGGVREREGVPTAKEAGRGRGKVLSCCDWLKGRNVIEERIDGDSDRRTGTASFSLFCYNYQRRR